MNKGISLRLSRIGLYEPVRFVEGVRLAQRTFLPQLTFAFSLSLVRRSRGKSLCVKVNRLDFFLCGYFTL